MTEDPTKRHDQIRMLEQARDLNDGKEPKGIFTYPNCGPDLVKQGLVEVTPDGKGIVTIAGRAALWFLEKGKDPTDGQSFQTFPLNTGETK